jgi:two-component system, LytTR family, response regulator
MIVIRRKNYFCNKNFQAFNFFREGTEKLIKAVIIDDEKQSRKTLTGLLERYCPNVMLAGEADGVRTGIALIQESSPDIVFLDIQMQDGSGFKLLDKIENINFNVIFTTAFDQYAIRAFKFSALDYLLKPIVPEELMNAVNRAETIKERNKQLDGQNIDELIKSYKKASESHKIMLATTEKKHLIEISNIIRCESDSYYTRFYFADGTSMIVSKTLKEIERMLSDYEFFRPHKSHLINKQYICGFLKKEGGYIVLTDGTQIPVARRKKEMVMEILNQL